MCTVGKSPWLLHQRHKWRPKEKLPLCLESLECSSRRGFTTMQLQIMNAHLLKNCTLLICYLFFFKLLLLLALCTALQEPDCRFGHCSVRSRQGRCSYSDMHRVCQRQRLQTCILKPIHYLHNGSPHPTQHGRLEAECEPRTFVLEES